MTSSTLRYPIPSGCDGDDLDQVVTELEEAWAEEEAEDRPVDRAAQLCPVFRYLSGGTRR